MKAIVGLGNPGDKYARTRHNVGFDVLSIISAKIDLPMRKLKCRAVVGEGAYNGEKLVLIAPQTSMNLSGLCVADALSWYKIEPCDMLIISDDTDLAQGAVRIRPHGGAGTHNGWRNIIQCTGSDRFPRIRVGIGKRPPQWDLADFVLSSYQTPEERERAFAAYNTAADAALCFVQYGIDRAMNLYNGKCNGE